MNLEKLKCDAWDTSFIVYQGATGSTIIESAETPGKVVKIVSDTKKLYLETSASEEDLDQFQKNSAWTIHELDWEIRHKFN